MINHLAESITWAPNRTLPLNLRLWFKQVPKRGSVLFAFIQVKQRGFADMNMVPQQSWNTVTSLGYPTGQSFGTYWVGWHHVTNYDETYRDFMVWPSQAMDVVITGTIIETDALPNNPISYVRPIGGDSYSISSSTPTDISIPAAPADTGLKDTLVWTAAHSSGAASTEGSYLFDEVTPTLRKLGEHRITGPSDHGGTSYNRLGQQLFHGIQPSQINTVRVTATHIGTARATVIRLNRRPSTLTGTTRARVMSPGYMEENNSAVNDVPVWIDFAVNDPRIRTGMIMVAQLYVHTGATTATEPSVQIPPGWQVIHKSPPEWQTNSRQVYTAYKVHNGDPDSGVWRAWDASPIGRTLNIGLNITFVQGDIDNPIQEFTTLTASQPPALTPKNKGALSLVLSVASNTTTNVLVAAPWQRYYLTTPGGTTHKRFGIMLTHDEPTGSPVAPQITGGATAATHHVHIMFNPPPAPEITLRIGAPQPQSASPVLDYDDHFEGYADSFATNIPAIATVSWPNQLAERADVVAIAHINANGTTTIDAGPVGEGWEHVMTYHATNLRIGSIWMWRNHNKLGVSMHSFYAITNAASNPVARVHVNVTFWRTNPYDPIAPGATFDTNSNIMPSIDVPQAGSMQVGVIKGQTTARDFAPPPGMKMLYQRGHVHVNAGAGTQSAWTHALAYERIASPGNVGAKTWTRVPDSGTGTGSFILNPPQQPANPQTHSDKLVQNPPIVYSRGLDTAQALGAPMAGSAQFTLHNMLGGVHPMNADIKEGDDVEIRENGVVVWRGFVEELDWDIDDSEDLTTVDVTCISTISRLTGRPVRERLWNDHSIRWALDRTLDAVRWPYDRRAFNQDTRILRHWPTRKIDDVFDEVARLVRTSGMYAQFYESGDGMLVFRNDTEAQFSPRSSTPQETYGGPTGIPIHGKPKWTAPERNLINEVDASAEHRRLNAIDEVWRLEDATSPIHFTRGRHFITAQMPDVLEAIAAPAFLNGDWGYAFGGGKVYILVQKVTAHEVDLMIDTTEADTNDTVFSFIRLRGLLRPKVAETHYTSSDWLSQPLIEKYGPHSVTLDIDPTLRTATAYQIRVNEVVERYGNGRAIVEWSVAAWSEPRHLDREIGDRVRVIFYGMTTEVTIYKIHNTIGKGGWHTITYTGEVETWS